MHIHTSGPSRHSNLAHIKRSVLALALMQVFAPTHANPSGMAVAAGAALQSNPNANTLQLVTLPGTILNWQAFSIARGETTRFVQETAASTVLNRVVGANPSSILGTLQSNGRVFLVNPNGIVFGGNSVVDTAGLIASTRELSDANFTAGNYAFSGFGNGDITLQAGAAMTTATYSGTGGGQIWLIAKNITTEAGSSITVPSGQVVLAAGNQVEVGTDSFGKMSFTLTTDGTNTLNSLGTIAADRGAVGLFADYVTHKGSINAANGSVTLHGGAEVNVDFDATINADGADGKIHFESNNLLVAPSGNVHAVGGQVTFRQYQPSQYAAGSEQGLWTTPPGFSDGNLIAFRLSDGNLVLRFQRTNSNSGNMVGLFEVVLDGRTGALLSGPISIAAGSNEARAYNTAIATAASYAGAYNTYDTAMANAQLAYETAMNAAYTKELADFDIAANTAAQAISVAVPIDFSVALQSRDDRLNALQQAVSSNPNAHPYLTLRFEIAQIVGPYRDHVYNTIRGAVYGSSVASAPVLSGMEDYVSTYLAFDTKLSQARATFFVDSDSASAQLTTATTSASSSLQSSLNARDTARQDRLTALKNLNASMVSDAPIFFSDGSLDMRGVPTVTRLPTSDGGAVVALRQPDRTISGEDGEFTVNGGLGAGYEVQSSNGTPIAAISSSSARNALPMSDGTYIVSRDAQYDIYKLDGTLIRSEATSYGPMAAPLQSGGFSAVNIGSSVTYSKVVPTYTPGTVVGSAGIASAFAVRAGAANSTGLPTPTVTPEEAARAEAARAAADRAEAARIAADRAAADQAAADRALAAARAAAAQAAAAQAAADQAAAQASAAQAAAQLAAEQAAAAQLAANQAAAAQAEAAQAAAQLAAAQAMALAESARVAQAAALAATQAAAQAAADQAAVNRMISADADRAGVDNMISADANSAGVDNMIGADADRTAAGQAASDVVAFQAQEAARAAARQQQVNANQPVASNTTQSNPFSRIPSCNSACGQMASIALTRVDSALMSDAMDRLASAEQLRNLADDARAVLDRVADQMEAEFMAQAQASDDASVRSLMDASMADARRDAINAFLQAKAGSIKDANMASNLMKEAQLLADNAAGGQINAFDAAAAARALRQYVEASRQGREMQLAAGMPVAAQLDAFLKDNGDLRRLVNGSRLDQMTVDQRVVAITRWLQEEERSQQQGTGLNARDPNAVTLANMVSHMSEQELITWANKIAREQAGGSNP